MCAARKQIAKALYVIASLPRRGCECSGGLLRGYLCSAMRPNTDPVRSRARKHKDSESPALARDLLIRTNWPALSMYRANAVGRRGGRGPWRAGVSRSAGSERIILKRAGNQWSAYVGRLDSGAPFIPIVKETYARMRFPDKWSAEIPPRNWVALIFLECSRLVVELFRVRVFRKREDCGRYATACGWDALRNSACETERLKVTHDHRYWIIWNADLWFTAK